MKKTGMVALHADEGTYVARFTYYPGHPGTWYRRNGDPGDPPEPAEVELHDVVINRPSGLAEKIEPTDALAEQLEQAVYDQLEAE